MSEKKTKPKSTKGSAVSASAGPMDVSLLERIVKLMTVNDLSSIDLRDGDKRISLSRGGPPVVSYEARPIAVPAATPAPAPAATPAAPPADEDAGLVPIKSPMVGTFYSASSPDAKPFVSVGSVVDEETDVCIIEAMKVFNNIKAETRGTIAKILVQNSQTVEFGQVLFLVKPG